MKALPLLLLMIASVADGEALRISEVSDVAGDNTERMTLRYRFEGQDKEEELFVLKEVIVGDADVAQASVGHDGAIGVNLKPEGARAMAEATEKMIPRQSRLAIIVDGKLVSAPGVRTTLGGNFELSGLDDDLDERALENLARRMSGRPELGPKEEVSKASPPPPRPETVPFTEEEYQQLKASREKMGIYHLESIPSKEELDAKLQKGMDRNSVIAVFGKPYMMSGNADDETSQLIYKVAPEKRAENPERKMVHDGFNVGFSEGKVTFWGFSFSNTQRERKVVGRVPGLLVASYPEMDFSKGDPDMIALIEGVKIPNIRQELNITDLQQLLSLALMTSNWGEGTEKESWISTQCDFMKILALHFPEAQDLVDGAAGNKVTLRSFGTAMSPYVTEGKPLPDVQAAPADKGQ
ncbi:MAG: hypothetical protein EOP88_24255 [Verrucomicrobiaceae bacterium]|nr:MAG: hypothetical protein EOP88_24255 [Verrucomicrobiaceae bacterium]